MQGPVLIVGGGIAGLATAAGFTREGIACEIVERARAWAPVGAGIVLGANAMRVMRALGIEASVARRGTRLGRGEITDSVGHVLGAMDFALLEPEFGPTIALHRAALHVALRSAAPEVPVRLDTSVEALDEREDHVDVRFTDGTEGRFALVIGADGLRSRVRELVFGGDRIRYAGHTCWRFAIQSPVEAIEMREMWGRGLRFGIVPIGEGLLYCFAVANAPRGEADPEPGRLDRFRRRFSSFGGQVPEILATLCEADPLIHNDLEELEDGPWQNGRIMLVGDAAHAMTPNMGQGAAMALEDASVLVQCLRSTDSLPDALTAFHGRRASRVAWVQNQSRRIGRIAQLQNPIACRLRNAVLRLVPDSANARALRQMASADI